MSQSKFKQVELLIEVVSGNNNIKEERGMIFDKTTIIAKLRHK